ncbi:iron complex transport system substrate-binding protein [Seinonella peptonophila]|uniref:Iron complex transport system substrate-binding protein n=1 Tax=Seinonella peptonophila TaxID=112248 RepID=A0A1M4X6V0_9BACL|nr:iron-hydroxamate ABC transporter substrate-binding protein [Seinonella peptonophila]SHE89219.1 iron complex transport system substrate-binding protein [Seinonella peptonophila]
MFRKKHIWISLLTLSFICILTACGGQSLSDSKSGEMKDFQTEKGVVKVPVHPKRIIVATETYAGDVLALGFTPVGVMQNAKDSKILVPKLKNVTTISPDNIEKIVELKPDLIITGTHNKNIDKLSKIAPTVAFTYGKLKYLDQHLAIAKLLGKEKEAQTWVEQWKKKTAKASKEIKAKIGQDATVMVMEAYEKELYVYGDNWGRATEVIYQALQLKMPEAVVKDAMGPGFYALSAEAIPKYAGDYIFLSKTGTKTDTSFSESNLWKNIPAVKNNRVYETDAKSFYFNDPLTLETELEFIKDKLLNSK